MHKNSNSKKIMLQIPFDNWYDYIQEYHNIEININVLLLYKSQTFGWYIIIIIAMSSTLKVHYKSAWIRLFSIIDRLPAYRSAQSYLF